MKIKYLTGDTTRLPLIVNVHLKDGWKLAGTAFKYDQFGTLCQPMSNGDYRNVSKAKKT